MSAGSKKYPNAPITEAIIEIRIATPLQDSVVQKASRKFSSHYPGEQALETHNFHFNIGPSGGGPKAEVKNAGKFFRRATDDQQEIAVITQTSLAISQLAPYRAWEPFFERFTRDFVAWRRVVGSQQVTRIGLRYINRIDIPLENHIDPIHQDHYLKIFGEFPEALGPSFHYSLNGAFALPKISGTVVVNTGVVLPPPVPNYMSLLLDFDLATNLLIPQKPSAILGLLEVMRHEKNRLFEECVTDKARELFQ